MCGYVLAALDSRTFYDQFVTEWAPKVAKSYPLPHVGIKELTPEEVLYTCILGLGGYLFTCLFLLQPYVFHLRLILKQPVI